MKCVKCGIGWQRHIKKCKECGGDLSTIFTIACVDALEMPSDVVDYCIDSEISTHYQNEIAQINNDGNPFAKWLISNGYKFKNECDSIGIIAT